MICKGLNLTSMLVKLIVGKKGTLSFFYTWFFPKVNSKSAVRLFYFPFFNQYDDKIKKDLFILFICYMKRNV